MSTIKTSFAGNWITSPASSVKFSRRKNPLICPACGKNYSTVPIESKCDSCGCTFCFDGSCIGTKGGNLMPKSGIVERWAGYVQNVATERFSQFSVLADITLTTSASARYAAWRCRGLQYILHTL